MQLWLSLAVAILIVALGVIRLGGKWLGWSARTTERGSLTVLALLVLWAIIFGLILVVTHGK